MLTTLPLRLHAGILECTLRTVIPEKAPAGGGPRHRLQLVPQAGRRRRGVQGRAVARERGCRLAADARGVTGASSLPRGESRPRGTSGWDKPAAPGRGPHPLQLLHTDVRSPALLGRPEAVTPRGAEPTQCPDADPKCYSSLKRIPASWRNGREGGGSWGGGQGICEVTCDIKLCHKGRMDPRTQKPA